MPARPGRRQRETVVNLDVIQSPEFEELRAISSQLTSRLGRSLLRRRRRRERCQVNTSRARPRAVEELGRKGLRSSATRASAR